MRSRDQYGVETPPTAVNFITSDTPLRRKTSPNEIHSMTSRRRHGFLTPPVHLLPSAVSPGSYSKKSQSSDEEAEHDRAARLLTNNPLIVSERDTLLSFDLHLGVEERLNNELTDEGEVKAVNDPTKDNPANKEYLTGKLN